MKFSLYFALYFTFVMALLHYLHLLLPPRSFLAKLLSVPEETVFHHLKISHWSFILCALPHLTKRPIPSFFLAAVLLPWSLTLLWFTVPNPPLPPPLKAFRSVAITFLGGYIGSSLLTTTYLQQQTLPFFLFLIQTLFFLLYPFILPKNDLFSRSTEP